MIPQTHHGLCVADIDAARAALASVGFTLVQPNAPEPLTYADMPDDPVGQQTCPDLGSPYRTHYVEHPGTGHQIDLIEIGAHAIVDRPTEAPLSGDLTVTMPMPDVDAAAARTALAPLFGERVDVTSGGAPWATLHLAASAWPAAEAFLVDALGVTLTPVAEGRWTVEGVGGRIDVAVSSATSEPPAGIGKRYAGANHLRFLHRKLADVAAALPRHPEGRWLLPPQGGFAFVAGPAGMTIELFDEEVSR